MAHEALIRQWPTLREWLDEDREGRLLHRRLTEAAQEWEALDRDPGALFAGDAAGRDRRLGDGPRSASSNQLEREFLAASRQASEREAERQRRTNRRLRALLIGAVVLLAPRWPRDAMALVQRSHARHAEDVAEGQALTADAKRLGTLAGKRDEPGPQAVARAGGHAAPDLPETRGDLARRPPGLPGPVSPHPPVSNEDHRTCHESGRPPTRIGRLVRASSASTT